jgi:hypothetical protein
VKCPQRLGRQLLVRLSLVHAERASERETAAGVDGRWPATLIFTAQLSPIQPRQIKRVAGEIRRDGPNKTNY